MEAIKPAEAFDWKTLIKEEAAFQLKDSLKTPEEVSSFESWRKIDEEGREARQLRKLVETATAAKPLLEKHPERKKEMNDWLLDSLNLKENIEERSRVEQFQALLLAEIFNLEKPKVRKEVEKIVEGLKKSKSTEGELNSLELMSSSKINFGLKEDWARSHFLPRLSFLARRDLEEAKKIPPPPEKPGELRPEKEPEFPPEDQDFLRPSIEELEKKEGEPKGYFVVKPFYGGYWKEKTFEEWDKNNLCFGSGPKKTGKAEKTDFEKGTERVMAGIIKGGVKTPLPLAYNFVFNPESLQYPKEKAIEIFKDEQGNYFLKSEKPGIIPFSVSLGKVQEAVLRKKEEPPSFLEIETGKLREGTERFLANLSQEKISPLEKARRLKSYVRSLLEYPGKGDSSYNVIYHQKPAEFFQKIEEHKKADCDVANAFYIALLSRLKIPARLATGYYIKIKDNKGQAVFTSGARHAWTEVWDNGWHKLDATPKGAPELDKEETDEKKEEVFEGDFGEIEAEVLTDEKLKEMIEEIKKSQKEEEERRKSPEEIKVLNFAKEANCSSDEAKGILTQIEQAKLLKNSKGENILNLLAREFLKIIKENLKETPAYRAPVRLPEADELQEPVEAMIDLKAGEMEPGGFKKYEKKIEKIQEYGGFDLILVCDKSGSMTETDPASAKPKWEEQQLFAYLLAESLHKFSEYCKINKIKLLSPIDVRLSLITFQAGKHEIVLPLSDKWGPKEQYSLWKNLQENIGGGTPDHLGLKAAQKMIEEDIEKEKEKEKERLRLIIVAADGGSDDKESVQSALKSLRNKNIVVEGVGLTESAKEIEATYYPFGKYLKSAREAPEWASQRIIAQVQKLYPKKIKK